MVVSLPNEPFPKFSFFWPTLEYLLSKFITFLLHLCLDPILPSVL